MHTAHGTPPRRDLENAMPPEDVRTHYRICPFCEANCATVVEADHATRTLVGVRGDKQDPLSKGHICPKAYSLIELDQDPDRLRAPLRKRPDGEFEEIGWDEALEYAGDRLRDIRDRHGNDAVGFYFGNPGAHNPGLLFYGGILMQALGSVQAYSAGSVDHIAKVLSSGLMFGDLSALTVPDIDRTDHFLVIGGNPAVSNGSLMTAPGMPRRMRALRERGGRLVVVDPRWTETAKIADEHHFIRPGTDPLLLLAMIDVLFTEGLVRLRRAEGLVRNLETLRDLAAEFPAERAAGPTGIPAEDIRHMARELASADAAAVYGRTGTTIQTFGSVTSWLIDALNALTGNLDRPGGAMWPYGVFPAQFLTDKWDGDVPPFGRWHSRVGGLPEVGGLLPTAGLADEILTPGPGQVRGFISMAGNMTRSMPNGDRLAEAFDDLEFLLSIDIYLNETSRHADLILPGPSYVEHPDFAVLYVGFMVRQYARYVPAIFDIADDMPHDWEVLLDLAARVNGVSVDEFEEGVVRGMLEQKLAEAGESCAGIDIETAREAVGDEPGPDRLYDILLRTGQYGDAFGARPDGLNLDRLKAAEHGVDYGPMIERLPDVLATPDRLIDLAPERFVEDLDRLRERMPELERREGLLLIGRRQMRSNNTWMHNLNVLVKGRDRCTLLVHPADARERGLDTGDRAVVTSSIGEITAPVEVSDTVMQGVVSLPHGWGHGIDGTRLRIANEHAGVNLNAVIDDAETDRPSANAVLNGIPVTVVAAVADAQAKAPAAAKGV
ncbi:MAG: molybdopterin-dependent oxidoreductase [Solirubrobacteraceae bacterium]